MFVRSTFEGMENIGKRYVDAIFESRSKSVFGLSTNSAFGQYIWTCPVYRRTIGQSTISIPKTIGQRTISTSVNIMSKPEDVQYTGGISWTRRGGTSLCRVYGYVPPTRVDFSPPKIQNRPQIFEVLLQNRPYFLKFYSRTGSFFDNLVSNASAQMSKIPVAFVFCFLQPDVFIFVLKSVSSFL